MVIFDASFLILMFDKQAASKQGAPRLSERISLLLEDIEKSRTHALIPTPALSEFLVKADVKLLEVIRGQRLFKIVPFDERASIEAAGITKQLVKESNKKDPVVDATWGKVKFDRQIIAIAKAEGADIIYTTDQNLAKQARAVGITCRGIEDLPMPQPVQEKLNYDKDKTQSEAEAIPLPTDVRRGDDGRASDETGTKRSEARTEQAAKEKKGKPPETPKGK